MTNSNIPTVIWPADSGEYKVMQFQDISDQPYLRFGKERLRGLHETILERFAQETSVQCTKIRGPNCLVSTLPTDCSFRLMGTGKCYLNLKSHIAIFTGKSNDYQIGINGDHLAKLRSLLPDWDIS